MSKHAVTASEKTKDTDGAIKASKAAADKHDANLDLDTNRKGSETNRDTNQGAVHHDFAEGAKTEHQFVRSTTDKTTGRETMYIGAPEVSMNPTSSPITGGNSWQDSKRITVNDAVPPPNANENIFDVREHPLLGLKRDQGMFIPNSPGKTTDDLMHTLNKEIYSLRSYGAQVEKDQNGDDIREMIIIDEKKRNDDGTYQLTGGEPVVGALQQARPKLIHNCAFTVHAVTKDFDMGGGKVAPEDGVLVIRVS